MATLTAPSTDLSARERVELRFSGFGGQGIILSGYIVGRAATVHAGRYAVMAQSYGPESRGGACMTELVVADSEIAYPRVGMPDLSVVMSQPADAKYGIDRPDSCLLIVDGDPSRDITLLQDGAKLTVVMQDGEIQARQGKLLPL